MPKTVTFHGFPTFDSDGGTVVGHDRQLKEIAGGHVISLEDVFRFLDLGQDVSYQFVIHATPSDEIDKPHA